MRQHVVRRSPAQGDSAIQVGGSLMRITLNGIVHDIDPHAARVRLAGHPPEPLQTHWVEMDGRR